MIDQLHEFDMQVLLQMMSAGFIFILFATKAYKKSYTTAIYVVSLFVALQCLSCDHPIYAVLALIIGAGISLARAVVQQKNDEIIRENNHAV